MPKAILEYDLSTELDDYNAAMDGGHLRGAAEEFSNYLRKLRKYEELTEVETQLLERIEKNFYEQFGDLIWK